MIILFLAFLLSLPTVKTDPFPPSFSKNTYSISVPEDQHVISQLLVVSATDSDVPLTFHQTSNFPEFELTTSGNLNLVQSLDRERISSYQINVVVSRIRLKSFRSLSRNVFSLQKRFTKLSSIEVSDI